MIFYGLLALGFGLGVMVVLIILSLLHLGQREDAYLEKLESLESWEHFASPPGPLPPEELEKLSLSEADRGKKASRAGKPRVLPT
jgi:hypothetical protein